MRKKVLFFVPALGCGGAELSIIKTINLLDKEHYEITLFIDNSENNYADLIEDDIEIIFGTQYRGHPKRNLKLLMKNTVCRIFNNKEKISKNNHEQKSKNAANHYLKHRKFDYLIANHIFAHSTIIKYIDAKKKYLFYHESNDSHHELLEDLSNYLDGLLTVSPGVAEMLKKNHPSFIANVTVIENYIPYDEIFEKSKGEVIVDIKSETANLCSCGRISKEKGFDLAVESAKLLKEKDIDFMWYFIGDGIDREHIEQMISSYNLADNVKMVGLLKNPFPLMKSCDIYVQPSLEESYCRTIKEAMILGKPIVSTDTVGGRFLLENGKKGILCDFNAQSLANSIQTMIEDKTKAQELSHTFTKADSEKEKDEFLNLWKSILL